MRTFSHLLPNINKINKNPEDLKEIFKNNVLYINNSSITREYIEFIRAKDKIKGRRNNKTHKWKDIKFDEHIFPKKKDQLNYIEYGKLCYEEKLINSGIFQLSNKPLISIIVPAFNKQNILLKSIRSIQNQSVKNIEIIIVDDKSTDDSHMIYEYLMSSDPRIRVFYHQNNLGVWRTRIDGFLYSNGKYIIHFDAGDMYEDNYVLEDALKIVEKYDIDSVKMICRIIYDYQNLSKTKIPIDIKDNYTKISFRPNIYRYNYKYFKSIGWIWTTLAKSSIYTKCLLFLSTRILNFYKNFWEDQWWKRLVIIVSENLLIYKRFSYLYFKDGNGEGEFKFQSQEQRNRMVQEMLGFLYFELELIPKTNNKAIIVNKLRSLQKNEKINFGCLKTKFYLLDDLLLELINDTYVSSIDKIFLIGLLKESKIKQSNFNESHNIIL